MHVEHLGSVSEALASRVYNPTRTIWVGELNERSSRSIGCPFAAIPKSRWKTVQEASQGQKMRFKWHVRFLEALLGMLLLTESPLAHITISCECFTALHRSDTMRGPIEEFCLDFELTSKIRVHLRSMRLQTTRIWILQRGSFTRWRVGGEERRCKKAKRCRRKSPVSVRGLRSAVGGASP